MCVTKLSPYSPPFEVYQGAPGQDKNIEAREARAKLLSRGKPYWRSIGKGLHI